MVRKLVFVGLLLLLPTLATAGMIYSSTPTTSPVRGTISPKGYVYSTGTGSTTFTVTPLAGYAIGSVTLNGVPLAASSVAPDGSYKTYLVPDSAANQKILAGFVVRTTPVLTAKLSTPLSVAVGSPLNIIGSASTIILPPTTLNTSYQWSVSPAGPTLSPASGTTESSSGLKTTFSSANPGTYTVTLKLSATGLPDSSATTTVVIKTAAIAQSKICIDCHASTQYSEYAGSLHANNPYVAVTCQACHNPTTPLMAHPGIADPTVSCSGCHTGQYAPHNGDFTNTCTTCHNPHSLANTEPVAKTATKPLTVNNLVFGVNDSNFITATFDLASGATPVTGVTAAATSIYFAGLIPGTPATGSDEWKYWGSTTDALVETPAASGHYVLTTNKTVAQAPAGSTTQRGLITFSVGAVYQRANSVYDFTVADLATPVAFAKDVVNNASCKECHGYGVTIHSFSRNDTRACVVCHSPNYNSTMATYEIDMVTMVHQIHSAKANVSGNQFWTGHGDAWGIVGTGANAGKAPVARFVYPDSMLNCTNCHNSVAQADNWKTKPTMVACNSCHTTITYDGTAYTGIKGGAGVLHTQADNSQCAGCHTSDGGAAPGDIINNHKPASSKNANLRPVESTISGANVDENGGVTVTFNVQENGAPKTNLTAATLTLAKLVPAAGNEPSYWQSYLSKVRTKGTVAAATPPVIQGRTETVAEGGVLTNLGNGNYSYKFALLNADVPGDIRTITHAHNNSSGAVAAKYLPANGLTTMDYPVAYEPNLTHRVALSIANNKKESFIDFVPANVPAPTRNIVSWGSNGQSCNGCHGTTQVHAGFSIEYCVGCHNKNSYDPYTGVGSPDLTPADTALPGTQTVELGTIVHKIHMGKLLPSVKAGGDFRINVDPATVATPTTTTHIYNYTQYPGGMPPFNPAGTSYVRTSYGVPADCKVCHVESNPAMTEAANWKIAGPACFSCHDTTSKTHGGSSACNSCHSATDVIQFHYGK